VSLTAYDVHWIITGAVIVLAVIGLVAATYLDE
jgi:hypothetical protein